MQYIPGIIAYFVGGFLIVSSKVLVWRIANHFAKTWVSDPSQADTQILALTFVITLLVVFGFTILVWSIISHINYKSTEKGLMANFAGGVGIAAAIGQDLWLNQLVSKLPYTS